MKINETTHSLFSGEINCVEIVYVGALEAWMLQKAILDVDEPFTMPNASNHVEEYIHQLLRCCTNIKISQCMKAVRL